MDQQIIIISDDKAYRCLRKWSDNIAERNAWLSPVSLFLSFLFLFVTTDFKDALNVSKTTWQAFAIFLMLAFIVWSIVEVYKRLTRRTKNTVDDVIKELKGPIEKQMDGQELTAHLKGLY